ncbi:MAG: hypothetical protein COC06_04395, partial [Bacteroidales bacterium]
MKKTSAMFFAMLFVVTAFSQNKLWEVDLKEALYEVGWIKQSNEGFIIASGAKGLLAMNNENGEIVWQNEELKAVDKNTYMNIDGLPIIYIEYSPIVGKTRGLLINSSTGNILYDTKDDEVRIKDFTLFPDKGYILFELLKGNERKVMCFSLKTLKKDWIADFGESKSFISKLTKATFVNHGPFFYKENLILGIENMIFSVNSANGEIIWKYEADKKIVKQKTEDIAKLVTLMGKYLNDAISSSDHTTSSVSNIKGKLQSINMNTNNLSELSKLQSKLIDAASSIEDEMMKVGKNFNSGKSQINALEQEISELKHELDDVKKESKYDHLTKLLTRKAYEVEVKNFESNYERNSVFYALVFLDIDHFK